MKAQLIDSHCHLNFPDFTGKLPETLERAAELGVTHMQTICTRLSEFPAILTLAKTYPNIWCSVGVHPNNVAETDVTTAEELIRLAQDPKVIGLGETGLDYYYEHSPREKQQQSFIEHIKASQATGLPVIVHTRAADEDTIAMLREHHAHKPFPGLIHCFSTSAELAWAAIELGMYISISGIITFKKAEELQAIVKELPLDRLLVETDAPYLAPVPYRGKPNEPGYTRYTAEYIAGLKQLSFEEVAKKTTENFFKLFTKAK